MKRLWLLRHLKSSWDEPGLADHDRPLAPRGRKAGKRVRQWAADHDVRPDLVLCSTAVRARATLDLVAPALGAPAVEFEDGLYHAWADDLLERLQGVAPDVESVLLIGHNPGLHDLVALLAPPGPEDVPDRSARGAPGRRRRLEGSSAGRCRARPARRAARAARASSLAAPSSASRTAALSRTLAPLTQSAHAVSSAGSWLTPPMRRDEHHPARGDRGERLGVVAGARRELHRRQAEIGGRARERRADALGRGRRRDATDGLDRHVEPVRLGRRRAQLR